MEMPAFHDRARILFQGDSITDGNWGRNFDPNHILGHGYVFIIAAKYGALWPERHLEFMNRGVSGNCVRELKERWKSDAIDLKPDLLSVLTGINDSGKGVPLDEYERTYDRLLSDARAANPKLNLVLGEPFWVPEEREADDLKAQDVAARGAIVAKLAEKHHAALVKYQRVFDAACERAPARHWSWDSVHPTYSGHQLMADEWVKTVAQI